MSKQKPTWKFDELRDSGVGEGGLVGDVHKRNLREIDVIVRESIQNAKDRLIKRNNSTLKIVFKIIDLTGKDKKDYLDSINWENNLSNHIKASTKADSTESKHLETGLKDINNPKKKLRIFVIEDYGCEGLTGEEKDKKGNFFNLTKANFLTSSAGIRGGSYGVGKTTLMKISSIRTLFFSSIAADNKKRGLDKNFQRLFGRIIIPSHTINEVDYETTGFFGILSEDQKRALSFENESLSKKIFLSRPKDQTGASISIVGFAERVKRSQNELEKLIDEATQRYYWPLLENLLPEKIKLSVDVITYENSKKIKTTTIDSVTDECIIPFVKAFKNVNNKDKISSEESTTKNLIKFEVSKRIIETDDIPKHDSFKTNLDIYLYRGKERLNNLCEESKNKIAFIRGFGQIVEYFKPKKTPYNAKLPYFGVLCVGTSKVDDFENENHRNTFLKYEEDFFRNLETQLHDRWTIKSSNFENNYSYKKNKDFIKDLEDDISQKIFELCGGSDNSKTDDVSDELSKLLSIGKGGGGKKPPEGFRVESSYPIQKFNPDDNSWDVELNINRKEDVKGDINVVLNYSLRSETTEKEFIPIKDIKIKDENKNLIEHKIINNEIHFILSKTYNACEFSGILIPEELFNTKPHDFENYDFKKIAILRNLYSIKESKF